VCPTTPPGSESDAPDVVVGMKIKAEDLPVDEPDWTQDPVSGWWYAPKPSASSSSHYERPQKKQKKWGNGFGTVQS